jgi:hypothetical protein
MAYQPARNYQNESCSLNNPDYQRFRIWEQDDNNDSDDENQ